MRRAVCGREARRAQKELDELLPILGIRDDYAECGDSRLPHHCRPRRPHENDERTIARIPQSANALKAIELI